MRNLSSLHHRTEFSIDSLFLHVNGEGIFLSTVSALVNTLIHLSARPSQPLTGLVNLFNPHL